MERPDLGACRSCLVLGIVVLALLLEGELLVPKVVPGSGSCSLNPQAAWARFSPSINGFVVLLWTFRRWRPQILTEPFAF